MAVPIHELSARCELIPFPVDMPRPYRLADLLGDWEADARAAHEALLNKTPRGAITGFPVLDREVGGVLWPGIHIIHGQPGTGKTAFALQIAASCGCPCLFITCEMAPLELLRRMAARITSTYLGRFKSGELPPADSLAKARIAAQAAPLLTLVDATRAFPDPEWITEQAQYCRGKYRHLLIIVDSLHSWAEGAPGVSTEYDALNAGLAALRRLSASLECPVLTVAERNRASMNQGGLSAGAGTRKIEYGAESVMDLSRQEKDKPDASGNVPVRVKLAKNRHGAPGDEINFLFNGALQSFKELGK